MMSHWALKFESLEEHLLLAAVFVKTDVRSIASEQSAFLSRAKSIYLAFN